MTDINHVVLIGRLTRDIELKYTNSGMPIGKLGIAVNRSRKKEDTWVEEVNFFNVTLMGKIAESLRPYLTKGKQIGVDGELRQNRWEQNGQAHSTVEIFANNIQLLGGSGGGGGGGGGARTGSSQKEYQPSGNYADNSSPMMDTPADDFEDDIPF